MGHPAEVLEMDGVIHNLKEGLYVEKFLHNTGAKEFGEHTQELLKGQNHAFTFNPCVVVVGFVPNVFPSRFVFDFWA